LELPTTSTHIWLADLEKFGLEVASLFSILSSDERERAARFVFERDRKLFIYARGLLRTLLGRYLSMHASALEFTYSPHGKPLLESGVMQFNISHSQRYALFAFNQKHAVGVDIEQMRCEIDYLQIAEHFFSNYENGVLRGLPAQQQQQAFFPLLDT
jgi:4'-phosphopantetheinyl transferase